MFKKLKWKKATESCYICIIDIHPILSHIHLYIAKLKSGKYKLTNAKNNIGEFDTLELAKKEAQKLYNKMASEIIQSLLSEHIDIDKFTRDFAGDEYKYIVKNPCIENKHIFILSDNNIDSYTLDYYLSILKNEDSVSVVIYINSLITDIPAYIKYGDDSILYLYTPIDMNKDEYDRIATVYNSYQVNAFSRPIGFNFMIKEI